MAKKRPAKPYNRRSTRLKFWESPYGYIHLFLHYHRVFSLIRPPGLIWGGADYSAAALFLCLFSTYSPFFHIVKNILISPHLYRFFNYSIFSTGLPFAFPLASFIFALLAFFYFISTYLLICSLPSVFAPVLFFYWPFLYPCFPCCITVLKVCLSPKAFDLPYSVSSGSHQFALVVAPTNFFQGMSFASASICDPPMFLFSDICYFFVFVLRFYQKHLPQLFMAYALVPAQTFLVILVLFYFAFSEFVFLFAICYYIDILYRML